MNYSSIATIDDGSCCYIAGCTDPYAINFNNQACFDDGSCILPILGCTNSTATNFNPNANTNTAHGGAIDNTFSTGGYFNGNQHLIFNSSENCVISSAKFYADVNTSVTFELRNQNGTIIDDTTHFVLSGEQRLDLNFRSLLVIIFNLEFQLIIQVYIEIIQELSTHMILEEYYQ